VSYNWDFGDGETSNEEYPTHIYRNPKKYDVKLTVQDSDGDISTLVYPDYIIVDGTKYRPISSWGTYGSGMGQLYSPRGIDIDSNGYVFVADTYNHRIQKFDSNGNFIGILGSEGIGIGQFKSPEGVAIDPADSVYIADTANSRIQKFSSSGAYESNWGQTGSQTGSFDCPYGVAINSTGYVYVVDTGNNRVQVFSPDRAFVSTWGVRGSEPGQFKYPFDLAIDSNDCIYVCDWENHRIQKFGVDHSLLNVFDESDGIKLRYPNGITVDKDDNVYVVNASYAWIYAPDGTLSGWFGPDGSEETRFGNAYDVATDDHLNVYVLDEQSKVYVFEPQYEDIVPDMFVSLTSGKAPMIVTFSDNSSGEPTSWNWDFGDNSVGSGRVVSHRYTSAGTYSVTLTVSNGIITRSKTLTDTIQVRGSRTYTTV